MYGEDMKTDGAGEALLADPDAAVKSDAQNAPGQDQQNIITSLFAAPPSQAALYTRENIHRYQVLKEAREADPTSFDWSNAEPQQRLHRQAEILRHAADQSEMQDEAMRSGEMKGEGGTEEERVNAEQVTPRLLPAPDWDVLLTMDPPRVDWIEEDGYYTCFGDRWPVQDKLAGLQEMGMRQFYKDDGQDRRSAMVTLLRTLLKSYLGLVDVLLEPPQEYLASEHNPATDQVIQSWRFASQDKAKEINDLSINLMHLLNETRPIQAKEELAVLLKKQLTRRREETELIKLQCHAMRADLLKIRES
jgi:hypothetical protein